MAHDIRPVTDADLEPLTDLWLAGWQEAHAAHVPPELTRLRSRKSFRDRLERFGDDARTAGPIGAPLGFCAVDGAEIDQLYVGLSARSTGLAAALLDEAVERIGAAGHTTAFLLCEPKNDRAAAFYTRMGWKNQGIREMALDTGEGPFTLPVFYFEKSI